MTAVRIRLRWAAAFVAGLAVLAAGMAGAQTPSVSSDISVTLVEIPVEVTRGDEPVRGLTAADFEVREGKRVLPIVSFETVDLEAPPEPDAPPPPPAARRHILFLLDVAMSDRSLLLGGVSAARQVLTSGLDPRDMVGVALYLPTGELPLLLSFTTDRAAAARTLDSLEAVLEGKIPETPEELDPLRLTGMNARTLLNRMWKLEDRNVALELLGELAGGDGRMGASLQSEILADSAAQHAFNLESRQHGHVITMASAIESLAKALRAVEGRKYLAFFSQGFDPQFISKPSLGAATPSMGGSDILKKLAETFEELRRSGWVLHGVDIAGNKRGSLSADALFYMANETGGKLVEGTNDLAKGFGRAMRRSAHSYLVSVQVDDVPFDGSYHKLEVRLRNAPRGVRVHHRGGYFAPLPFRRQDDVRRLADAARLVSGDEESDDLGVQVVAVPLRSGGETVPVAILLEVPGDRMLASGAPRIGIEVYGYALDEAGSSRDFFAQSVDLDPAKVGSRLAQGGVRILGKLAIPRGEHRLRVLVRDRADGRTSLLTVPLSLSGSEGHIDALFLPLAGDPWLLVRPQEADFSLHGRSVLPAAQAMLSASGEAQLLVVGHGLAGELAGEKVLHGRILDAMGRPVTGGKVELLAVTPGESGEPDLVVGRLSAGSLPPGSYLLELRLGNQPRARAVTARPFRVSSAM
ncbi:MAG TPA: VWA domain-containing protein [Thermoanaerobaculia bacterium]|nr:VWA domain-containing protein [Thermoanaerobaculia bacterium]